MNIFIKIITGYLVLYLAEKSIINGIENFNIDIDNSLISKIWKDKII